MSESPEPNREHNLPPRRGLAPSSLPVLASSRLGARALARLGLLTGILAIFAAPPAAFMLSDPSGMGLLAPVTFGAALLAAALGLWSHRELEGRVGGALGLTALLVLGIGAGHVARRDATGGGGAREGEERRLEIEEEETRQAQEAARVAEERRKEAEALAEAARQDALAKAHEADLLRRRAEWEKNRSESEAQRAAAERERARAEELRRQADAQAADRAVKERDAASAAAERIESEDLARREEQKRRAADIETAYRKALELYRARAADRAAAESELRQLESMALLQERISDSGEARRKEIERAFAGLAGPEADAEKKRQLQRADKDLDACRRALARIRDRLAPARAAFAEAERVERAARAAWEEARAAWVARGGRASAPAALTILRLKDGSEIRAVLLLETAGQYHIKDEDGQMRVIESSAVAEIVREEQAAKR